MSSNDDEYGPEFHRGKRRIQRACDICRRKKSRCDGGQVPGDKCSTCIHANLACTYVDGTTRTTKRAPATNTYIEFLEARLDHSEAQLHHSEVLVRQLRAELASVAFAKSSNPDGQNNVSSPASNLTIGETSSTLDRRTASLHILRSTLRSLGEPPPPPHADDLEHRDIQRKFEKLTVTAEGTAPVPSRQFLGKSSEAILIQAAIDLKADARRGKWSARNEDADVGPRSQSQSQSQSQLPTENRNSQVTPPGSWTHDDDEYAIGTGPRAMWTSRRLQYWTFKPWENTRQRTHAYSFPPPELMADLIELYFRHANIYLPLLHRPTFEKGVASGLHRRDDGFAATLLLVCAVGSRWSTDPRVMAPTGSEGVGMAMHGNGRLACGWGWFNQVSLVGNHLFGQASLYDLQCYCLAVQFLKGSSAPQACWTLIGIGLRLAQDVGAHRRTSRVEKPSVEAELWKRAFWTLVYMDRSISVSLGRTCAIQHDDLDIDLPIECDDECWEHPTHPFQQPPGIPSRVAYFNMLLRLDHILAFSLKLLYSLTKVRVAFAIDDTLVVAELDSALNRWRDEVPAHLRWDPMREDPVFFDQSVALHCAYSHLQILIHRPFIPMMRKSAPTALPSLAICTSAARTCANMVDVQRRRKGQVPVVVNLPAVFMSGIVLLLNVWSGKRAGIVPDPSREIANVHKCMEVVRLCEDRWQTAGLLWDILLELASVGQLPLSDLPSGNSHDLHPQQPSWSHGNCALPSATSPPLPLGVCCTRCQAFDPPGNDPYFCTPYAQPPHNPTVPNDSFAGVTHSTVGGGDALGVAPMEPSVFTLAPPDTSFPPEEQFDADPAQASRELDDMMSLIDSDTIAMWTNAPNGIEVDDWGNYFHNFSEIMQGQQGMMRGDMGMYG